MARARRASAPASADPTLANLNKIDHIVVLMLENRSFDHMLGYLTLEAARTDVDGLKASMSNAYRGKKYKVRHLQRTALTKDEDPCHGGACVAEQVGNNMGGFVANFAKQRTKAKLVDVVMGYYHGSDLPTYDHLAREFAVCDRWYCSVPGATWPNRLYALCRPGGREQGPEEGSGLRRAVLRAPSRVQQGLVALVHARRRDAPLQRQQVSSSATSTSSPTSTAAACSRRATSSTTPRTGSCPPSRGSTRTSSTSLRRPVGIERRPPALGHQGRPGARAQDLHGARQQPELEEDDARRHLRRARRLLRPRAPAGRARRPARLQRRTASACRRSSSPRSRTRASVSNTVYDHTSIIKTILLRFCQEERPDPRHGRAGDQREPPGRPADAGPAEARRRPSQAYRDAVDRLTAWRTEVFRDACSWQGRPGPRPTPPT